MDDDAPQPELPANLKFLRILVTTLTVTMIVGVIAIVVLLVIRLPQAQAPLPPEIALPAGATPSAFTQGTDWVAVVTADDRILIYDRSGQTLRQEIRITTPVE